MTRATQADLLAQSQATTLRPVWLARISTGTSPATVYVTSWNVDVAFPSSGGNTYSSRPMQVPEMGLGEESEGGGVRELRLGDGDGYWKALGATWPDKRVVLLRVDADHLSTSSRAYRNDFIVDAPEWGDRELVLHLLPFRAKSRRMIPRDLVTRTLFPGHP